MDIIGVTKIDFVGKRRYAYFVSGVLLALGIAAFILLLIGKGRLGIEFSGGTLVELSFKKPVDIGKVRDAVRRIGVSEAEVQQLHQAGEGSRFLIRAKRSETVEQELARKIVEAFKDPEFSGSEPIVERQEEVGPSIGRALRGKAIWAVVAALIAIMIYIAIRFEFRFGVAAAIATLHDVVVVFGLMWLLGREITLLVVSALLTLAGYSLTDTVVVFDRIRENLRARRKEPLPTIINASINEVLHRTVITATTTFLASVSLLAFGGPVIRDFSLALSMGIVVGTYSSIFVASPILIEWQAISPKEELVRVKPEEEKPVEKKEVPKPVTAQRPRKGKGKKRK
jgi:preprotein translocase subunit SecF